MCSSISIRGGAGNHPSEYHQSAVGRYCDFVKSIMTFGCASSTDHPFVDHYESYLNYRLRTLLKVRESDTLACNLSELGKNLSDAQDSVTITDRAAAYVAEREYGGLMMQWEVAEICHLEGCLRFLPMPSYEGLQVAARYSPVIILIANEYLCIAIVVPTSREPHHVRFTHLDGLGTQQCCRRREEEKVPLEQWIFSFILVCSSLMSHCFHLSVHLYRTSCQPWILFHPGVVAFNCPSESDCSCFAFPINSCYCLL
ncbi:hypothetical protein EDB19DRAFT_1771277 [Suillus lakei]|nr:hypothetical protein EDB19DRAFT_1771277 [Suillus lakei]